MISKLLTAAALAGTLAGCTQTKSLAFFPRLGRPAPVHTGSLPPAGSHQTGLATVQTVSLAPNADVAAAPAAPTGGHVDVPGSAPHSHDDQEVYGEPGDPNQPARVVEITMAETDDGQMIFTPSTVQARAGEQIRFKVRNAGQLEHEFVLATPEKNKIHAIEMQKNPDMEHDDPNAVRVAAGQTGEMAWKFTNSGKFEFACLIPGHRESGMIGLAAVI